MCLLWSTKTVLISQKTPFFRILSAHIRSHVRFQFPGDLRLVFSCRQFLGMLLAYWSLLPSPRTIQRRNGPLIVAEEEAWEGDNVVSYFGICRQGLMYETNISAKTSAAFADIWEHDLPETKQQFQRLEHFRFDWLVLKGVWYITCEWSVLKVWKSYGSYSLTCQKCEDYESKTMKREELCLLGCYAVWLL
jgi:hypothetical protein